MYQSLMHGSASVVRDKTLITPIKYFPYGTFQDSNAK